MELFSVKIIMQYYRVDDPIDTDEYYHDDDFYEESIRIVKAKDFEDAEEKARKIAEDGCEEYTNIYGQIVYEEVYDVIEVFNLFDLEDGAEVFSSYFKISDDDEIEDILDIRCSSCTKEDLMVLRDLDFNKPVFKID